MRFLYLIAFVSALLLGAARADDPPPPDFSTDKFPPYPPLNDDPSLNFTAENWRGTRLYGWKGCDTNERNSIVEAFNDLNKLSGPLASNIDWSEQVTIDFWGENEGPDRVPDHRRTEIQQIFKAQAQMWDWWWHIGYPSFRTLWIEVRCSGGDGIGDPDNLCEDAQPNDGNCGVGGGKPVPGGDNTMQAIAQSTTSNPELRYSRLLFCNAFFKLPSLSEVMATNARRKQKARNNLENYDNKARVFQHETTHLDYFMNTPGQGPYVQDMKIKWKKTDTGKPISEDTYGPLACKVLRNANSGMKDDAGYYPQRNGDSYAWFALGSYIQRETGKYPKVPSTGRKPEGVPTDPDGGAVDWGAARSNNVSQSTSGNPQDDVGDDYGEDAESASEIFLPHCPDSEIIRSSLSSNISSNGPPGTAPPPEEDKNACHGINGDYWVMSRDVAVQNVQDFCSQTDQVKRYNVGSVNELELSVKKLDDDTLDQAKAPDCIDRFTNAVIDGCDGGDTLNNPHNYKFGSTLTAGGWEYKMTPLSKQANDVNCDMAYKFFFDSFEIRGKNWPDALFGANGEGLYKQIAGCGAITKWNFEKTPGDCCFQWYASGQLPIGTKSCVGRAIQSAGSASPGNCQGPGKRDVAGHSSIDNWPGYGDDSKHVFKTSALGRRGVVWS